MTNLLIRSRIAAAGRTARSVAQRGGRISAIERPAARRVLRQRDAASAIGPLFVRRRRPGRVDLTFPRTAATPSSIGRAAYRHVAAITTHADLPPFQGGWAGLFGYELAGSLERVPQRTIDEFGIPALGGRIVRRCRGIRSPEACGVVDLAGFSRDRTSAARRERGPRDRLAQISKAIACEFGREIEQSNRDSPSPLSADQTCAAICNRPAERTDEQLLGRRLSPRRAAGHRLHPRRRCIPGESFPTAAASGSIVRRSNSIAGCGNEIRPRSPVTSTAASGRSPALRPSDSCGSKRPGRNAADQRERAAARAYPRPICSPATICGPAKKTGPKT